MLDIMAYARQVNDYVHRYWPGANIPDLETAGTRVPSWERYLTPLKGTVKNVLEVGSWRGQSALFWLRFFDAAVTCVDNWENPTYTREAAAEVERAFDANIVGTPIIKVKLDSTLALHAMARSGARFDLIYIDGDHSRDQVMVDSCLAWKLLKTGGIMIWDDYREYCPHEPDEKRPERAIDTFIGLHREDVQLIADTGQQLFVRKC
jgi:predicted O-methyltransferase YrrM